MKQKTFEQIRVQIKGDIEENLKKAIGFVPLDRELVVRKPDEKYKYPRLRMGDGKTNVNDLPEINVQPNWEQTDPSQPDFIKNKPNNIDGGSISWNDLTDKPFERVEGEFNFITDDGFIFNEQEDGFIGTAISIPKSGENCIVSYNGTDYNVVARELDGAIWLGNLSAVGMEDTGEPFVIIFMPTMHVMLMLLDGATEANVAVKGIGEIVKPLNPIFYNSPCVYYIDSKKYLYFDLQLTKKVTRDDLKQTFNRPVIVVEFVTKWYYAWCVEINDDYGYVEVYIDGRSQLCYTAEH